jgi:spore germination protein YaaH
MCRTMRNLIRVLGLLNLYAAAHSGTPTKPELWAFTGPWDPRSAASLRANATRLDVAVTGWIALDSNTAKPILPPIFPDTVRLATSVRRMAIVTSWHGDRFHPTSVRTLARDDGLLAQSASAIAAHAAAKRYAGLVLDLESLERGDRAALLRVIKIIGDSARAHGVKLITVAIPAADTAAYPAQPIIGVADFVMPMLYDQHWSTSAPGAISEPDWVRSMLAMRIAEVGASKIVAALPTYGYRWAAKRGTAAQSLSFAEAQQAAQQERIPLARDSRTRTLRAVKPGEWEIWATDAELLATLAKQATDAGVRRIALWRIGQEDPAMWRALGR